MEQFQGGNIPVKQSRITIAGSMAKSFEMEKTPTDHRIAAVKKSIVQRMEGIAYFIQLLDTKGLPQPMAVERAESLANFVTQETLGELGRMQCTASQENIIRIRNFLITCFTAREGKRAQILAAEMADDPEILAFFREIESALARFGFRANNEIGTLREMLESYAASPQSL